MLTGWTNQVTSWIGAKKNAQESSPQDGAAVPMPEEATPPPADAEAVAQPAEEAVSAEAVPETSKSGELFSSMKSQVSSWLGPFSKKEAAAAKEEVEVVEQVKEVEEAEEAEPVGQDGEASSVVTGLEEVSNKAMQGARTIGNFFASAVSKAGKTVTEAGAKIKKTVEETTILTEFNKEQEAFIRSKNKSTENALPPWVGYPEEEALKEQILSLSQDRRNFLRSPPAGVQFQFDYETSYPVAMATLFEDPSLQTMRFELVPKLVNEETFWRNYFYRVSLIRQSTALSSMAREGGPAEGSGDSSDEDKTEDADPVDSADPGDSPVHEFVSDAYQSEALSRDLKEVQEGVKRLGSQTRKLNDDEWEKELQAELQDYELASEGSGHAGGADADEIEEMLDAEDPSTLTDLK